MRTMTRCLTGFLHAVALGPVASRGGILLIGLSLAACGGGGDGGGSTTTPTAKSWGTAQLIETDGVGASVPQVAVDGSGNALAVWTQLANITRRDVWANRFSAGTLTWGTAQLIETDDAGTAANPQIAVDGSGNAIAVWQQSDGMRNNIWANRFD